MNHPADEPEQQPPKPKGDPRLEIPDVLRERPGDRGEAPAPKRSSMADTAKAWGVALDFVFTTLTGALLGWLFDRWQGTLPWGTLVGLSLGFVGAFVRIIRFTQRSQRRE